MKKYIKTAAIAEGLGLLCLFLFQCVYKPEQDVMSAVLQRFDSPAFIGGRANPSPSVVTKMAKLQLQGNILAQELDVMNSCLPFVVGFPVVAVFALWIQQRRASKSP
jgi:hypothetical protein